MVKFLGYELRSPFKRATLSEAKSQALSADTSQGLFHRGKRDVYKPEEIEDYYEAYEDKDLVRAPIDDLVESALGQGYYTTVEDEKSKPCKELVDDFAEYFNLDELIVNIGKNMLIAGYCPVETKIVAGPIKNIALKVVHPKSVEEVIPARESAEPLTIDMIIQRTAESTKTVKLQGRDIAHFIHGRVGNDPRGMSYVRGMINVLNTLDTATENVDLILDRYIAPIGIWKQLQGRQLDSLKKAVLEREPGEDVFLGDLTIEEFQNKVVEFISIDPRVPFWEYIVYLDRRIYAYTRSNNLWYSKDATVASAETLDKIVQRHVKSLQRSMKRTVERCWFKPLIKLNLGEKAEVPKMNFGAEPTGVEEIQIEPFLTQGLTAYAEDGRPYLTRAQYYGILAQLGVKIKAFEVPAARPVAKKDVEEYRVTRGDDVYMIKKFLEDENRID